MGEVTRRISFGMGMAAQERVDHPVLDRIAHAEFAPQRKLAQSASAQLGTVGSGGGESVILEGVESADSERSLCSTVHGAGRVMSRTQAAGRVRRRKRWSCGNRDCDRVFDTNVPCPNHPQAGVQKVWVEEQLASGIVDWPAVQTRLREQGIVLVGGGADEAPEVYKPLPEVLATHGGTIRVKHTLRPLGVAMAGREVVDPYKD